MSEAVIKTRFKSLFSTTDFEDAFCIKEPAKRENIYQLLLQMKFIQSCEVFCSTRCFCEELYLYFPSHWAVLSAGVCSCLHQIIFSVLRFTEGLSSASTSAGLYGSGPPRTEKNICTELKTDCFVRRSSPLHYCSRS